MSGRIEVGAHVWHVRPERLLLLSLVLSLVACADAPSSPPADAATPDGDSDASAGACGTVEGLDDAFEFVGSCLGEPDSDDNQGCIEYITQPNALFIGTDCLAEICASAGATWHDGAHCPGGFELCSEMGGPGSLQSFNYLRSMTGCP